MVNKERWTTINIPKEQASEVEKYIWQDGYTSIAELVRDQLRKYLAEKTAKTRTATA